MSPIEAAARAIWDATGDPEIEQLDALDRYAAHALAAVIAFLGAEETYRTISDGMAYASAGEIVEELKDLAKHHEP